MTLLNPRSLRWRLVIQIAVAQTAMLALIFTGMFATFGMLWYFGAISNGVNQNTTPEVVSRAVRRDADGRLFVASTPELLQLKATTPNLWFLVRDVSGQQVTGGPVPQTVLAVVPALDVIAYADLLQDLEQDAPPSATIQWMQTVAGHVKIMSSAQGSVTVAQILQSSQSILVLMALLTVTMALATLLATPFVVGRAMKGLNHAALETNKIDIDRSGTRLSTVEVPLEILPFIHAVNEALSRLDRGYESHRRFLTDAAHELRTPIAILTTRLSGLPSGLLKSRLLEDAARLTALTGQLLDLQRLDQQAVSFTAVDLVKLGEHVVIDLAPLAFGAGYEMLFEPAVEAVIVLGDQTAIERALTNLVQNAINYGGRQGAITVRISASGWMEVCDQGKGVPAAEHEHIFEAFHRLRQDGRGVGLGLDLVQKIMRLHGGRAEVRPDPGKGACFRLTFPLAARDSTRS
ncbi:HAMP domain-containing histidine kinase [Rhizobium sp. VS19-DR104.2]|uniref:sensor histidine kinase n=1 Tax=unclassified Rhizobium TaxID=2613769 RepID=UPI001CC33958|nr:MULTISPECIES: HAMP domain-containing sensor histidine kinase [unclassified Rhizobium]MBZ5762939.1 HAMP domain-containing histidine kinase [Rhizobium sp. VS19-DR96]MBZ5768772.1 HAMP domain-containing histidine kinase [Rhizobium sp. VS19-DR129.2]MBZ5776388.1 HAMP domain-containing histidine kinase [Rhizobium sp. VS19-DRK62.2]MBZ5787595.1 HAMP domain-containing histidine kinase [Rhizobium sp. VS19-DR121]MBZ5804950.1 HAMP domain-containing histidine kinase [Rhizobium sp. VS19-DR181]